jgi:hypothetical protein
MSMFELLREEHSKVFLTGRWRRRCRGREVIIFFRRNLGKKVFKFEQNFLLVFAFFSEPSLSLAVPHVPLRLFDIDQANQPAVEVKKTFHEINHALT